LGRYLVIAARSGQDLLPEPTSGAQVGRRELVILPHSRPSWGGITRSASVGVCGICEDFEKPVRRDSTNDHGVAASAGRINRVEGSKRLASGRYGTGNLIEKIADTGHIGRPRQRHPANVGPNHMN
jgi:hypothetical protein